MAPLSGPGRLRVAAIVLGGMFLLLATWVELAGSIPGDERALIELNEAIGTRLDALMGAVGAVTNSLWLAVYAVVVVMLLRRDQRRREALVFLIAVGVVLASNPLLKEVFARPRPSIRPSPETVSTHSFPSGHAAGTAGFVCGLLLIVRTRRWRLLTIAAGGVLILGVAFSRLAIGVHYPSDILAAWLWVGAWTAALASVPSCRDPGGGHPGPQPTEG